jgi:2-iminobutanoate/2-iminopropanoate deaminase
MPKESLNPPGLMTPFGPFVQVTTAPAGRLVFVSGQISVDADGNIVGAGDIVVQTRQVMENLKIALAAAGAGFEDVVKINNYVTDKAEYPLVAPIREEYLQEPYPASTLVEVSSLIFPALKIEIEAIAVVAGN